MVAIVHRLRLSKLLFGGSSVSREGKVDGDSFGALLRELYWLVVQPFLTSREYEI